jgi:hypothetical protein
MLISHSASSIIFRRRSRRPRSCLRLLRRQNEMIPLSVPGFAVSFCHVNHLYGTTRQAPRLR